jgi:hypothetical protein
MKYFEILMPANEPDHSVIKIKNHH